MVQGRLGKNGSFLAPQFVRVILHTWLTDAAIGQHGAIRKIKQAHPSFQHISCFLFLSHPSFALSQLCPSTKFLPHKCRTTSPSYYFLLLP
jgi:siderophore synthetase component